VWCLPFGEPRLRRASRLRREPHGFAGCLECRYQVEPATASLRAAEGGTSADPAEMARRYGPETPVPSGVSVAAKAARAGEARDGWSVPVAGAAEGVSPFGRATMQIWW
jgi:hypothetical protein